MHLQVLILNPLTVTTLVLRGYIFLPSKLSTIQENFIEYLVYAGCRGRDTQDLLEKAPVRVLPKGSEPLSRFTLRNQPARGATAIILEITRRHFTRVRSLILQV